MNLDNVRELKNIAKKKVTDKWIKPFGTNPRNINHQICFPPAIGIHPTTKGGYKLAIDIAHKSDLKIKPYSKCIESLGTLAKGEVDIKITGNIYLFSRKRPLSIGISISHFDTLAQTGTLGCFVRKRGETDLCILSNNHILANENEASIGDVIVQPSIEYEGHPENDCIAYLEHFIPLEKDCSNVIDAAIARLDNANVNNFCILKGFYDQGYLESSDDITVFKFGQTTHLTCGRISRFGLDRIMPYKQDLICEFENLIAIEGINGESFSDFGDSGSLIFNREGYAIALVIGGSKKITYACPIDTVLYELDIEIAV
ncbi:MAG: hypothetical protein F6K10_07745 [Moorea sp. SIO2B7]|nr:hypothetical protein [Moorena sp. SIO2B7]